MIWLKKLNRILMIAFLLSAVCIKNADCQILSKSSTQKVSSLKIKPAKHHEPEDPLDALDEDLDSVMEDSGNSRSRYGNSSEEESEDSSQEADPPVRKVKNWTRGDEVTVAPVLGVMFMQSPYVTGLCGGCEFIFNTLISPFFFGASARGEIGFPSDNFPYEYVMDGQKLRAPDFIGGTISVPIGLTFDPFHNGITVNTYIRLGLKLCGLVSTKTVAKSNLHAAFYSAICIGMAYKHFDLSFSCEYDTVGGFAPAIQLGYRFNIGVKKYKNQESENE